MGGALPTEGAGGSWGVGSRVQKPGVHPHEQVPTTHGSPGV